MKNLIILIICGILLNFGPVYADDATPSATPTPVVDTGNALSVATAASQVNTNIISGNLQINTLTLSGTKSAEIIATQAIATVAANISANITNIASVSANLFAIANTGISSVSGQIQTGLATASAGTQNIVNTNVIASQMQLSLINVTQGFSGNIIFPNFSQTLALSPLPLNLSGLTINNTATVSNSLAAIANSGSNSASLIGTGNSLAQILDTTIANTNIISQNLFQLQINNLANWTGKIYNWNGPGTVMSGTGTGSAILATESAALGNLTGTISGIINNAAQVQNNVLAVANTGVNNSQTAKTGTAAATATTFNLINTNVIGSDANLNNLNILGDWTGNLIFGYPDLAITAISGPESLYAGDTGTYTVDYQNLGYADDNNVVLHLPPPVANIDLGTAPEQSTGSATFDYKFDNPGKFSMAVNIDGADQETDYSNNSSQILVNVLPKNDNQNQSVDTGQPIFKLSGKNNTGNFVNPGDTIIFEYRINNSGNAWSDNTHLDQQIYSPDGKLLGTLKFNLGKIDSGRTSKLTFYFRIKKGLPGGEYKTLAMVFGNAPDGTEVRSESVGTVYKINNFASVIASPIPEVSQSGEVLGTTEINNSQSLPSKQPVWPYLILFLAGLLLIIRRSRVKNVLKNYVRTLSINY